MKWIIKLQKPGARKESPQWGLFCIIITISFACIFVGCANRSKLHSKEVFKPDFKYKAWFFKPPYGTAVGFSSAVGPPRVDARVRLTGEVHIRIKGFKREFYTENESDQQDSIFFYYDSIKAAEIYGKLIVLDSFRLGNDYAILASLDPIMADTTTLFIYEHEIPSQKFILSNDGEKIFSQASSPFSYYNMGNAWVSAEEKAVKNLCEKATFYFASLEKYVETNSGSESSQIYKMSFDLSVSNVKVKERYYDCEKRTCHVVVSCLKSNVRLWEEN